MLCAICEDKGIVVLPWSDAPDGYAVCLCAVGRGLRTTRNFKSQVAPLWRVWAAREQVDPERVWMIEDVLPAGELAALGFGPAPQVLDREAALLAAGKSKRAKL